MCFLAYFSTFYRFFGPFLAFLRAKTVCIDVWWPDSAPAHGLWIGLNAPETETTVGFPTALEERICFEIVINLLIFFCHFFYRRCLHISLGFCTRESWVSNVVFCNFATILWDAWCVSWHIFPLFSNLATFGNNSTRCVMCFLAYFSTF